MIFSCINIVSALRCFSTNNQFPSFLMLFKCFKLFSSETWFCFYLFEQKKCLSLKQYEAQTLLSLVCCCFFNIRTVEEERTFRAFGEFYNIRRCCATNIRLPSENIRNSANENLKWVWFQRIYKPRCPQ